MHRTEDRRMERDACESLVGCWDTNFLVHAPDFRRCCDLVDDQVSEVRLDDERPPWVDPDAVEAHEVRPQVCAPAALVRDYGRRPEAVRGLHLAAFVCIVRRNADKVARRA